MTSDSPLQAGSSPEYNPEVNTPPDDTPPSPDYAPPVLRLSHNERRELDHINAILGEVGIDPITTKERVEDREKNKNLQLEKSARQLDKLHNKYLRLNSVDRSFIPPFGVFTAHDNLAKDRETFKSASVLEKLQILLESPVDQWTLKEGTRFFSCSEHLVRQARKMKTEGIRFVQRASKRGQPLSHEQVKLVESFYLKAMISRESSSETIILDGQCVPKYILQITVYEAFLEFREAHPQVKISRSKFYDLRPKNVIIPRLSQAHRFCMCITCQNLKLMLAADHRIGSFRELIPLIACDCTQESCMLGECLECKDLSLLRLHLEGVLGDKAKKVQYKHWENKGNSCEYLVQEATVGGLIESIVSLLTSKNKEHLYFKNAQQGYYQKLREDLDDQTLLLLMDFAENVSLHAQEEVSNKFYRREMASLFTAVVYRKVNGKLQHRSYGVFSDDLKHDVSHVMLALRAIRQSTPRPGEDEIFSGDPFAGISKICYFTDGARQHFKSKNSMWFLGLHNEIFGVPGVWHFHCSGHGKSPCDGVGASLKNIIRRRALKETPAATTKPILNALDIYRWSLEEPSLKTTVCLLDAVELKRCREVFQSVGNASRPVVGISTSHCFEQISRGLVQCKKTSTSKVTSDAPIIGNEEVSNQLLINAIATLKA